MFDIVAYWKNIIKAVKEGNEDDHISEDGHNALHSDQDEIESNSSEDEDNDDGRESQDHSFSDAQAEMLENMNEASLKDT